MFQKNKLHMACQLALLGMLATSSTVFAQQAAEDKEDDSVEVIEVTGFRSSIAKSIDRKRESKNVVDAIIAEDIGKMPDENIAEALQRVTGVSITRDFGEGGTVSVRGMGADLNQITVNGQTLTSGGDGRGVSFTSMSADLLSAIEVVKTPSANHDEGSIGGSVNLKTLRPLTGSKERMGGEVKYSKNDLAENDDPSANFNIVRHFNDKIGVMANISFEQRNARQDSITAGGWDAITLAESAYNVAPSVVAADQDGLGFIPRRIDHQLILNTRERLGGAFNIEYKHSDDASFLFDLTFTHLNSQRDLYQTGHGNSQGNEANRIKRFGLMNPVFDEYGTLLYGDFHGELSGGKYKGKSQGYRVDDRVETETQNVTVGFSGDITVSDNLMTSFKIGRSQANEDVIDGRKYNFQDAVYHHSYTLDPVNAVPGYSELSPIIEGDSYNWMGNQDNNINLLQVRNLVRDVQDTNTFGQVDFDYLLDSDVFSSVAFGVKATSRTKTRLSQDTRVSPKGVKYPDTQLDVYLDLDGSGVLDKSNADGINEQLKLGAAIPRSGAALEGAFPVDNFGTGLGLGADQGSWGLIDFDNFAPTIVDLYADAATKLQNCITSDSCNTFTKIPGQAGFPAYEINELNEAWDTWEGLPWDLDPRNSYDISIDTQAAYFMTNIDALDGRLRGDMGLRYVRTEERSAGYEGTGIADVRGVEYSRVYENVLPSVNLSYATTEDTLVRLAVAQVMARPTFTDIMVSQRVSPSTETSSRGNPNVDPFEANQVDLTWEWYYTKGSMVSAGLFFKDITSFSFKQRIPGQTIVDPSTGVNWVNPDTDEEIEFVVTQPASGEAGTIAGLEVNYQQDFAFLPGFLSNMGAVVNYTLTDSTADYLKDLDGVDELTGNTELPFLGQSEHTLNTQLYYETKKLQLRLAHNYRTEYLVNPTAPGTSAGSQWVDAYGQLDFSGSYQITPKISLRVQATNLTNATPYSYQVAATEGSVFDGNTPDNRLLYLRDFGRTLRMGLNVRF